MKKNRNPPVHALDIAAYILANHSKNHPIFAWKMHILVYYCQAWSLVREGQTMFHEKIMASPKGVVINELLPRHHHQLYLGDSSVGNLNHLSLRQVDTIDYVMKIYGPQSLEELNQLILHELPWIEARQKVKSTESVEINLDTLLSYYGKKAG